MTLYILIATIIISLIGFSNDRLRDQLIFDPYLIQTKKQWYRFVTCGFLHADSMHLLVNMLVLYSFGKAVEYDYAAIFGSHADWVYAVMYVTSIAAANVSTFYKERTNPYYRALGASGAVSAVVFVSILFNPYGKLILFFAIELPAVVYGVLYVGYSWYMSKKQSGDLIHHEAHLHGAFYGMLFTIVLKPAVLGYFLNQLLHF